MRPEIHDVNNDTTKTGAMMSHFSRLAKMHLEGCTSPAPSQSVLIHVPMHQLRQTKAIGFNKISLH